MKRFLAGAILIGAFALPARAQVLLNYSWSSFNEDSVLSIPDGNATGVSDTRTILERAVEILKIAVNLEISGGFNGDLYVTLQHDLGFSILLNRAGRAPSSPFGYDDKGFAVTLADSASNGDIHTYRNIEIPAGGLPLTGTWQPDARLSDPSGTVTASSRTAFLQSFQGENLAGDWTLFAADLSSGGQAKIISWGLEITVVPEPQETALLASVGLLSLMWLRLRDSKRARAS